MAVAYISDSIPAFTELEDNFKISYTEPTTAIPGILHASQESRQVGLQFYIDFFDQVEFPLHSFVNPTVDILCFAAFTKCNDRFFGQMRCHFAKTLRGNDIICVLLESYDLSGSIPSYFIIKPGPFAKYIDSGDNKFVAGTEILKRTYGLSDFTDSPKYSWLIHEKARKE